MNDETSQVPFDSGQDTWDELAARIDALIQRWESAVVAPALEEFAPAEPGPRRRLVLVELIKVDLDYRHQRHQPRRIEDYVAEFPELRGPSGLPADLIFEEFQVRRRMGDPVKPHEYFDRFPGQTDELARLLQINAPTLKTTGNRPRPHVSVNVGDRLDDFDLQTLLGEGAFARVFLAWQRSMQRRVALKVSADQGDEPQTLAQLDHPHIVRVYDQRQLDDRNLRLLYMPYLPGGTLHDVLKVLRATAVHQRSGKLVLDAVDDLLAKRNEPIPTDSANRRALAAMTWPEAVCHLGARLAEALDYAHRQGILHRDIKPANVLLGADAAPLLADFNVGVSSKLEGASPSAFFGGSLPYMSPEQIEAFGHQRDPGSLDGRCDVYSLGVTLWELLTGRRPFAGEPAGGSWAETLPHLVMRRKAGLDPAALAQLPAIMPVGLKEILLKCLEGEPDRRFANAGELARQLDLCLKPEARRLLYPEPGWRTWVRRNSKLALYPTALIPAALASWFSIEHNKREILGPLPELADKFVLMQYIANGTLFPLGMLAFYVVVHPVSSGLKRLGSLNTQEAAVLRARSLRLGIAGGLVCLVGYVIAGLIFPAALQLDADRTFHFLAAQTLCGLISVSYPLVGMTFIALRTIYPAFLPAPELPAMDARKLRILDRVMSVGLVLAASVPLLSVGLLALIQSKFYEGMVALSVAGLAGFALAYWLVGQIRDDIRALLELVRN